MLSRLARDVASLLRSFLRSRASLAAENLFLRKQLAFYKERKVKPRRADEAAKIALVLLSRCFERHRLPKGYGVSAKSVLGGLHHEYRIEKLAA